MEFQRTKEISDKNLMPTYAHFNAEIVSGKGATLTDVYGKNFIDFTSGIGVNSLGYGDEKWVKAVKEQASSLQHISNLYYNPTVAEFTQLICEKSGFNKVFLCNSGAEANECAIKLARKYSFDKYGEGRANIITLKNSFHGRTMATITATGQEDFHKFFHPFLDGFKYTDANNIEDFSEKLDGSICGVILEVIQGEGGVYPLDKEFISSVFDLCKENDILVIFDEVQTGVGRTGKFFAWEHFGKCPDVLTTAKGLGNGMPIGACLCKAEYGEVLTAGTHGTTFGGNPIACAGATEVLNRIDGEFLAEVIAKGEYIKNALLKLKQVDDVRGMGMMLGVVLKDISAKDVAVKCVENGLLILTAKELLRLLPPLTITYEEIDRGIDILKTVLSLEEENK